MAKRAVVWAAVSSEEQARDDKESLAHQEAQGRAAAAAHGLDVVEVITSDDSRSVIRLDVAMRNARLGYRRLVELLDKRAFDVLIFYNADRLGRNRGLLSTVQEECVAAGVVLYDLSNPPANLSSQRTEANRILWSVQAASAQNDVEKFKERARWGRMARAKRGLPMHRIPYGYRRADDGSIVIDAAAAGVLRRIFNEYLVGHGLPRIAAGLNADSIPTPRGGAWQTGTLSYILNNVQRYAGWMEINRYSRTWRDNYQRVRAAWPALIDDATAEHIIAERTERSANRKLADTPHLLSGVVWCMECEKPLRVSTVVGSGRPARRHTYLRCVAPTHPFWQVRANAMLPYIQAKIAQLSIADIDALCDADDSIARANAELDANTGEIARLQRALQDADDAHFVAGTLDAARYQRTVSRLQTEIANRQADVNRLTAQVRQEVEQGGKRARLLDVLRNGERILRESDPTAANVWLRQHVRVWVRGKELRDGEVLVLWL